SAEVDPALQDLEPPPGEGLSRRARHHGAVGDREPAAVAGTDDRAVAYVGDRAALVGARGVEDAEDPLPRPGHHVPAPDDLPAAHRDVPDPGDHRARGVPFRGMPGGGGRVGRPYPGDHLGEERGGAGEGGSGDDGATGALGHGVLLDRSWTGSGRITGPVHENEGFGPSAQYSDRP